MALVHNRNSLAEPVGFLHIVRGQHNGDAPFLEGLNALPEEEARLRVQVVGWLVKEQHLWTGKGLTSGLKRA